MENESPRLMNDRLEIVPLMKAPNATVRVPGSKSITNRALVLAALSGKGFDCELRGCLKSEDTEVMIDSLRRLGFHVEEQWAGENPHLAKSFGRTSGSNRSWATVIPAS